MLLQETDQKNVKSENHLKFRYFISYKIVDVWMMDEQLWQSDSNLVSRLT